MASPDWPGGDNSSKKTMQRFDALYWYTGVGSAGSENGSAPAILTKPSAAAEQESASVVSSQAYLKIIINETQHKSSDNQKDDFVELYNPNSEPVSLTDWYLQIKTAGVKRNLFIKRPV